LSELFSARKTHISKGNCAKRVGNGQLAAHSADPLDVEIQHNLSQQIDIVRVDEQEEWDFFKNMIS